ncbi:MAG: thiamine pyrophosphate-dependent enzyme [Acetobacteraceae bacterium]
MAESLLERRRVVAALLSDPGDMLIISGLGSTTYDVAAAGDRPLNFYLWGAMGSAAMLGLGLALAQPSRRVLVLTGDGEALMGLGALATIAAAAPANLAIAVLDNACYGETGAQVSHTALGTDLAAAAAACGWRASATVNRESELEALRLRLRSEPLFAVVKIAATEAERVLPSRDGVFLQQRFRAALGIVQD